MKKNNIILFLSLILLSFSSCETVDFGDTNENTNGPLDLDTGALLAATQRRYATIGGGNWLMNPHLYMQYQAQPVYQTESRYAENPVNWAAYYSQTLSNLQQIIRISNDPERIEDPAYLSNGSVNNQIGIARIMKVIIYYRLTNAYGDIPYIEALDDENQSPAYTPQEEIYTDFITELTEARDMMDSAADGPSGDIIYGGNVSMWQRLANTLLLHVSMQMSEANESLASSTFLSALNDDNGVIETTDQEAWYQPINAETLVNPWTSFRAADYNMAEYFQDALQGDEDDYSSETFDARLTIYSDDPDADGLATGLANYPTDLDLSVIAQISPYITSATSPQPWFTGAYTYLQRAEAAERGWTSEDAEEMLRAGIVQSFTSTTEYFGMGPHTGEGGLEQIDITDEADDFADARIADAAETSLMQVIGEEKWASLFPQGFLAWNEWRRLDYPVLTPAADPLNDGEIPTRYLYPQQEINLNNANYQVGVGTLSPAEDRNTSRVWWDVD